MNEITEYLKDVAALECQLHTQNRLLVQLRTRTESLGHPRTLKEPEKPDVVFNGALSVILGGIFLAICSSPIIIGASLLIWLISSFVGFFFGIKFPFIATVVWCSVGIMLIVAVVAAFSMSAESATNKSRYARKLAAYKAESQADAQRVEREIALRYQLVNQWHQVKAERDITAQTLDSAYAIGLIHPKYRGLVPVSSFYDYFDTGICSSLTGPGGAYAVYEEALRFKRVETRLDVIIDKLDEIIENQQYIGDLMRDANATLYRIEQQNNSMLKSINQIRENSELTEYNTRCAAQCAIVTEHIAVYQALNNC